MSANQLFALTPQAINPQTLAQLSPQTLASLSPEAKAGLSSRQLSALTPQASQALGARAAVLTPAATRYTSAAQAAMLTPAGVAAQTPEGRPWTLPRWLRGGGHQPARPGSAQPAGAGIVQPWGAKTALSGPVVGVEELEQLRQLQTRTSPSRLMQALWRALCCTAKSGNAASPLAAAERSTLGRRCRLAERGALPRAAAAVCGP